MGRSIVSLDDLTNNNLGVLRKLIDSCLPFEFPDSWYYHCLDTSTISKLAYYAELPVGVIRATPITTSNGKGSGYNDLSSISLLPAKISPDAIHLDCLVVLPQYRNLAIGQTLLNHVIEKTKKKFLHQIIVHVHQDNHDIISWFEARGFVKQNLHENYFPQLSPPNAWVLKLEI